MRSPNLYVKLDPATFESLQEVARRERRELGDEIAILLKRFLPHVLRETDDTALTTTARR